MKRKIWKDKITIKLIIRKHDKVEREKKAQFELRPNDRKRVETFGDKTFCFYVKFGSSHVYHQQNGSGTLRLFRRLKSLAK